VVEEEADVYIQLVVEVQLVQAVQELLSGAHVEALVSHCLHHLHHLLEAEVEEPFSLVVVVVVARHYPHLNHCHHFHHPYLEAAGVQ